MAGLRAGARLEWRGASDSGIGEYATSDKIDYVNQRAAAALWLDIISSLEASKGSFPLRANHGD
jgi:hypothetical protein